MGSRLGLTISSCNCPLCAIQARNDEQANKTAKPQTKPTTKVQGGSETGLINSNNILQKTILSLVDFLPAIPFASRTQGCLWCLVCWLLHGQTYPVASFAIIGQSLAAAAVTRFQQIGYQTSHFDLVSTHCPAVFDFRRTIGSLDSSHHGSGVVVGLVVALVDWS